MEKHNSAIKNVLIYCRESRDDKFENYERIETQRDILINYCKQRNLGNIYSIIMDDNKSGTNFDRLNPVRKKIINNEVDIILMKDASRLGRNILESLKFTSFLDSHNIELVFESENYDEDIFPLIAWFNERRAKDDSIKIRRVLKHKMEDGSMVIKAPYGYIKSGNTISIDKKTAPVVKEIFDLFLEGHTKSEIAKKLNKEGHLTPSQYRKEMSNEIKVALNWSSQHIDRILKHIIYTGDMPYGMREKVNYKTKKNITKKRENWIIIKDHHPKIIYREIFESAQQKLVSNYRKRSTNTEKNIFFGIFYCGKCGSKMYRKTQKGKEPWYICSKNNKEGVFKQLTECECGCLSHRITEKKLIDFIKLYINLLMKDVDLRREIIYNYRKTFSKNEKVQDNASRLKEEIKMLNDKLCVIYNDKIDDIITQSLFLRKKNEFETQIDKLSSELVTYEKKIEFFKSAEYENSINTINENLYEHINYDFIIQMFKKIIIYEISEISHEDATKYNINGNNFEYIYKNGGVVFIQSFSYKNFSYTDTDTDSR